MGFPILKTIAKGLMAIVALYLFATLLHGMGVNITHIGDLPVIVFDRTTNATLLAFFAGGAIFG